MTRHFRPVISGSSLTAFVLASALGYGPVRADTGTSRTPTTSPASSATDTIETVWLANVVPAAIADNNKLERIEDLRALFAKLPPRLMVHTTVIVGPASSWDSPSWGQYCAHAWLADCVQLEPSKARPADARYARVPQYDYSVWWKWVLGDGAVRFDWEGTPRPLAKNTPGFIMGSHQGGGLYFLAADGSQYVVQKAGLALGVPLSSDWPAQVQHTMYDVDLLEDPGGHPGRPQVVPAALVAELEAPRKALQACAERAWKPADREFDANDAANITERTRENRADQIEAKYQARSAAACKAPLAKYAAVMKKVLDTRKAERQALYLENKARFAK